jgi:cell division protein FtsN
VFRRPRGCSKGDGAEKDDITLGVGFFAADAGVLRGLCAVFYSVLPQREVEITISDEERAAIENPSINKDVVGQSILQVGSFHSAAEADSMKAQLAFLGLEANVKPAVVNDETWHRVQLGPFPSETSLSRAKNLLIENEIKYMQRSAQ